MRSYRTKIRLKMVGVVFYQVLLILSIIILSVLSLVYLAALPLSLTGWILWGWSPAKILSWWVDKLDDTLDIHSRLWYKLH